MIGKDTGQLGFADWEAGQRQRKKGAAALERINAVVDWRRFEKPLRKAFKDSKEGAPSYPVLVLFRVLLLQQWYGLSDPAAEEAVADRLSFRRFVGLSLSEAVPDETTICRFRGRLAEKGLTDKLLGELERQLDAQDLLVKQGTLVDASLVQAASRPPKKRREAASCESAEPKPDGSDPSERRSPDAEADWTVKRGQPVYGFKLHLGVDWGSGLIRKVELTPASAHDSKVFEPLLSGDEGAVYADKAYDQKARRNRLSQRGINDGIMRKAKRNQPLSDWDKAWNRYLSTIRAPVERVFGTLKRRYGFSRARYLGLARNRNHAGLQAFAHNLRRATSLVAAS